MLLALRDAYEPDTIQIGVRSVRLTVVERVIAATPPAERTMRFTAPGKRIVVQVTEES